MAQITWQGGLYLVPVEVMDQYKVEPSDTMAHSAEHVFEGLTQKVGEAGMLLRGLRYREGLSQVELAKQLGITQTNLSAMENGRRSIGKALAKRIAGLFSLDYRMFL